MPAATQVRTSGGRPTGQQKPRPKPPAAARTSAGVQAAIKGGAPAVTLGGATTAAGTAEPIGVKLVAGELDLSTGELAVPEATAAAVKEGGELETKVRLPGLAEGTLRVRKHGQTFGTAGTPQAILLRHPALARFAAVTPTVLVLDVKENHVGGWVGLGMPGQAKGSKRSFLDGVSKGAELLGWAGLSKITVPAFRNQFVGGVLDVGVENLSFSVGGFLSGTGAAALDNKALSFDGAAKIEIPGGASGELVVKKDPTGALSGKLDIVVQIGSVAGTVTATLSRGFVSVMGSVAYSGDRLSGKLTLAATDEATARDITLKKPQGGDVPIELPGPDKPAKPGKRAFCGWGTLTFRVTDWLAGTATVIVNSKGQATIVGEIAPPKEFILFPQKEWVKRLFKLEIRAGYGIPVVGQVALFASIALDALAAIGPGKLYNIKLAGAYSTDPRVPKQLSIEGSLNISAFAGLRLRAEAGLVVTILGHDIKAGVGLNAIAGVRGYVEATPRIGMREPAPGKREYYIQGHLEIAAQPVLGFSGDLFVAIETPWWSPLSDKRWTWPLFSIEYPLPGEFGIGADVDYVLGSKQWPKIEFGEVAFDSSKFMTDVMNDNTDSGSGGEKKKPGDWKEGKGGKGPGGAKNKGGKGKTPGDMDDDLGPIGARESFSDGAETHQIWFEQKGATATLMMASGNPSRIENKLDAYEKSIDLLYTDQEQKTARVLLAAVRKQLPKLGDEANQLASMKLAARKAKEVYEKNKDKPRKKSGQKKGKDGGKEKAKQVKADEHALRDPLSKLALLLLEVPFKPIKRPATMHQGQQDAVEVLNDGDHAGLHVARVAGAKRLHDGAAAAVLAAAHNKAGHNAVKVAAGKVDKIVPTVAKAKTRQGKINAAALKRLEDPAGGAQAVVGALGKKMQIANLARLAKTPIERMPKPVSVVFPVKPAELEAKAKQTGKNAKLYKEAFVKEFKRQVELQSVGVNKIPVDNWVFNINVYKLDRGRYLELDHSARIAILDEFKLRAKKALETTKSKRAALKSTLAEIKLAMAKASRGEDAAPAPEKVEIAAGRTGQEKVFRKDLGKVAGQALQQRSGSKESIFQHLLKQQKTLEDEDTDWSLLADNGSQLVILHNPDQVGGGYDKFNTALLNPPPPTADLKTWKAYLKNLMEHVGPRDVNSSIGSSWKNLVEDAYKRVTAAVVQESYALNRLNLPLSVKEG